MNNITNYIPTALIGAFSPVRPCSQFNSSCITTLGKRILDTFTSHLSTSQGSFNLTSFSIKTFFGFFYSPFFISSMVSLANSAKSMATCISDIKWLTTTHKSNNLTRKVSDLQQLRKQLNTTKSIFEKNEKELLNLFGTHKNIWEKATCEQIEAWTNGITAENRKSLRSLNDGYKTSEILIRIKNLNSNSEEFRNYLNILKSSSVQIKNLEDDPEVKESESAELKAIKDRRRDFLKVFSLTSFWLSSATLSWFSQSAMQAYNYYENQANFAKEVSGRTAENLTAMCTDAAANIGWTSTLIAPLGSLITSSFFIIKCLEIKNLEKNPISSRLIPGLEEETGWRKVFAATASFFAYASFFEIFSDDPTTKTCMLIPIAISFLGKWRTFGLRAAAIISVENVFMTYSFINNFRSGWHALNLGWKVLSDTIDVGWDCNVFNLLPKA